ncbi:hypothetical protein N7548_00435 [Acholeplasma manati]|uniref:Uncharacterized protein n=1 Tax=Paracholeplasma manati TaxID=591373 RepID=A0ABT2Y3I4_9MOLU|nr:hypothetical protein [Paracholeplasma manati]MCV2231293.1 hypothetical protein [Paracholeplasma manati]
MIHEIIFNAVASIILIYVLFSLLSLLFNTILAYKHRKLLQELNSEERAEEIKKIKKNQSKRISWLISNRLIFSYFTLGDYKKTVIESQDIKNEPLTQKPGVDSIIFSIFILIFTLLVIGSSFKTDLVMMQILTNTTRLISIVIGLFLIFRNLQINYLQFKQKNKLIALLALLFNVLSICYFGFVSFYAIIEIVG